MFKLRSYWMFDDFECYVDGLEDFFETENIVDEAVKKAILVSHIYHEAYVILVNVCRPQRPRDKSYSEILHILRNYVSVRDRQSVLIHRREFYRMSQIRGQPIDLWADGLKRKAGLCRFRNEFDKTLVDRFISGLTDVNVQKVFWDEDPDKLDFARALEIALRAELQSNTQNEET